MHGPTLRPCDRRTKHLSTDMPIPFDPAGPEKDMRNQRHAAQIEVA